MNVCPHCALPNWTDPPHVCDDPYHWTRNQRDEWRTEARRRFPATMFVRTYSEPPRRGRIRDLTTVSEKEKP